MKTEAQYIAENNELKERNQKLEAELFLANSKLEECNRIVYVNSGHFDSTTY